MLGQKNGIYNGLSELQNKPDVTEYEVNDFTRSIIGAGKLINEKLSAIRIIDFTPLTNIDTVEDLITTIHPDGKIRPPYGKIFENNSFNTYMQELDQSLAQLQRIEQKSMSALLLLFQNE